eukprot:365299-Chlamydomonas_euryale.AAC.14
MVPKRCDGPRTLPDDAHPTPPRVSGGSAVHERARLVQRQLPHFRKLLERPPHSLGAAGDVLPKVAPLQRHLEHRKVHGTARIADLRPEGVLHGAAPHQCIRRLRVRGVGEEGVCVAANGGRKWTGGREERDEWQSLMQRCTLAVPSDHACNPASEHASGHPSMQPSMHACTQPPKCMHAAARAQPPASSHPHVNTQPPACTQQPPHARSHPHACSHLEATCMKPCTHARTQPLHAFVSQAHLERHDARLARQTRMHVRLLARPRSRRRARLLGQVDEFEGPHLAAAALGRRPQRARERACTGRFCVNLESFQCVCLRVGATCVAVWSTWREERCWQLVTWAWQLLTWAWQLSRPQHGNVRGARAAAEQGVHKSELVDTRHK